MVGGLFPTKKHLGCGRMASMNTGSLSCVVVAIANQLLAEDLPRRTPGVSWVSRVHQLSSYIAKFASAPVAIPVAPVAKGCFCQMDPPQKINKSINNRLRFSTPFQTPILSMLNMQLPSFGAPQEQAFVFHPPVSFSD